MQNSKKVPKESPHLQDEPHLHDAPRPEDVSSEDSYFYAMGNVSAIPSFAQAALELAQVSGDKTLELSATMLLGIWADRFSDHEQAIGLLTRATQGAEIAGKTLLAARARFFLSVSRSRETGGDRVQIPVMKQILEKNEDIYTDLDKAIFYSSLAVSYFYTDQTEAAARNYYTALSFAIKADNPFVILTVLNNLGSLQTDLGNMEEAQMLFRQALSYKNAPAGCAGIMGIVAGNLSIVLERAGLYKEAKDVAGQWIDRLEEISVHSRALVNLAMAQACARLGEFSEATHLLDDLEAAVPLAECTDAVSRAHRIAQTFLVNAVIADGLGNARQALEAAEAGIQSLTEHLEPDLLDRLREQAAQSAASLGEWERAYNHASASLAEKRRKISESARGISLTLGIKHEVEKAYRERDLCRELSLTDPLTGLLNRRFFGDASSSMLSLARRESIPVSLAMIDLDRFKAVNDTYGHAFGDTVLVEFAKSMKASLRQEDVLVRYGGEEFCIIMPGAEAHAVKVRLEAALAGFSRIVYRQGDIEITGITWSAGVDCSPDGSANLDTLIRSADGALYKAKESGRARVVLA